MRYLSCFRLFESSEIVESDFIINVTDDDIKDIFMEVVDIGYEFEINKFYLSNNSTFISRVGLDSFYPIISIRLDKNVDDIGDSTNWDGSIYFA